MSNLKVGLLVKFVTMVLLNQFTSLPSTSVADRRVDNMVTLGAFNVG